MYAKWIGDDLYTGPKGKEILVIKKGDIRRVVGKANTSDDKYILEGNDQTGANGPKFLGWIDGKNIEILS